MKEGTTLKISQRLIIKYFNNFIANEFSNTTNNFDNTLKIANLWK